MDEVESWFVVFFVFWRFCFGFCVRVESLGLDRRESGVFVSFLGLILLFDLIFDFIRVDVSGGRFVDRV